MASYYFLYMDDYFICMFAYRMWAGNDDGAPVKTLYIIYLDSVVIILYLAVYFIRLFLYVSYPVSFYIILYVAFVYFLCVDVWDSYSVI